MDIPKSDQKFGFPGHHGADNAYPTIKKENGDVVNKTVLFQQRFIDSGSRIDSLLLLFQKHPNLSLFFLKKTTFSYYFYIPPAHTIDSDWHINRKLKKRVHFCGLMNRTFANSGARIMRQSRVKNMTEGVI